MRTAVMRVVIDADGVLSADAYRSGLRRLRDRGIDVVASPAAHLPDRGREIELVLPEDELAARDEYVAVCTRLFGVPAAAGVVTFISRGTDEDAHGVLARFGVEGTVDRTDSDVEVVTVVLDPGALRRVAEGRLHTALEAALNCEVRIVTTPGSRGQGTA